MEESNQLEEAIEGLDDFDREIAEEKLMQLDAMETARLWLRRIEKERIK